MSKSINRRVRIMQKDTIEKAAEKALNKFDRKGPVDWTMADFWIAAFRAGAKWAESRRALKKGKGE